MCRLAGTDRDGSLTQEEDGYQPSIRETGLKVGAGKTCSRAYGFDTGACASRVRRASSALAAASV
jgi:hypothetical protein